jgi:1-acyl-sn-glycerol-3-phosphate acyltransferase
VKQVGSLIFWAFVVISSILLFPIALLIWLATVLFDRRLVLLHRFTCFWASLYTWLNPLWPVRISGREHIEPHTTYVLAANHLSLLDILVLFRLFRDFKWVSKAEIFKVPLIGWNMSMNRYIRLQRGQRDSVVQMMQQAQDALEAGSSIMMFPEGTRSKSGELQRFKTGAFELALATGVPVVPIVISGTHNALPKHGFVLQGRHEIGVAVLQPVPPTGTPEQLAQQVRDVIEAQLG